MNPTLDRSDLAQAQLELRAVREMYLKEIAKARAEGMREAAVICEQRMYACATDKLDESEKQHNSSCEECARHILAAIKED